MRGSFNKEGGWNLDTVVRDDNRQLVDEITWSQKGYNKPKFSKAQTIINVLTVAKLMIIDNLQIFTDCKSIMEKVTTKEKETKQGHKQTHLCYQMEVIMKTLNNFRLYFFVFC